MLRGVRRLGTTVLVGCALLLTGWVAAPSASACSCALGSTAGQVAGADVVFTGTLVSREVEHPDDPVRSSSDRAVHVFAVDTLYKGTAFPRQVVVSADSGASCGLELQGDGPFLIVATSPADAPEGQLAADLCGGSAQLTPELEAEVQAVVAVPEGLPLAHPETPLPGARDAPGGMPVGMEAAGSSAATSLALEVGAGLGALLAGVLVVRSRRSTRRTTAVPRTRD